MLLLIGSVYGDEPIEGVSAPTFLLIGLLGYGVAANASPGSRSRSSSAGGRATEARARDAARPGPYLTAVIGSTVVVIALQVIAQLLLGVYALDADWPDRPLFFAFAILLGAAAFAALGIAITTVVRTAEGSSAVVNAIYLPMAFISGSSSRPRRCRPFCRRSPRCSRSRTSSTSSVRASSRAKASTRSALAALSVWGLVGLVCIRRFRWEPRGRREHVEPRCCGRRPP